MALHFYLNNKNNEIFCNTNSTFTELAGAFNIGTIELEWNDCKHSIFPHTKLYIEEDTTNSIWYFDISRDDVEVAKKSNVVKYLHKLTVTQLTHSISNVPLRNSQFTQPYNANFKYRKATLFANRVLYDENGHYTNYGVFSTFNHVANEDTFLANNYSFSLGNVKIKKGTFKLTSILNIFQDYDYVISSMATKYGLSVVDPRYKFVNQYVTSINFWLVNADDPTDTLHFQYYSPSDNEYVLSQAQLTWIQNKSRIYLKMESATVLDDVENFLPSTVTRAGRKLSLPLLAGLINFELNLETYKYSLLDVIYTLLRQASKDYNGVHLEYQDYIVDSVVNGVDLDSIVAPEFDFTGLDLYEAIAKVYSFVDAFPVMYEDENNHKHISCEFLNDLSQETIEEVEQADRKVSLSEENFTNKLASFYQNGKKSEPITFPSKDIYRLPSNAKYGIAETNDWYWYVSKPIDYIESIKIFKEGNYRTIFQFYIQFAAGIFGIYSDNNQYIIANNRTFFDMAISAFGDVNTPIQIDLTDSVFSSDVYKNLPLGYAYGKTIVNGNLTYKQNQNNTLYYSRGDNKIYLGITGRINKSGTNDVLEYVIRWALLNMVGIRSVDMNLGETIGQQMGTKDANLYTGHKQNYPFNVTYYPILDGKVSQESTSNKSERETIVAQGNSGTLLNRLGNNLQGLIAKLGNEEQAITLPITKFKDKIKLGTKFIDDLDNTWIANKIQTTFSTNKQRVIVNVTFTRNYNALAQFTQLNQEKRFYDISEKITSKGYENINEFLYFTNDTTIDYENIGSHIALHHIGLNAILEKTFNSPYTASVQGINFYDYKTEMDTSVLITHGKEEKWTFMPIVAYGCGNQICFEMGFEHPMAAGSRIEAYQPDDEVEYAIKEWLYTDDEGTSNVVDIRFLFLNKYDSREIWRYPQFDYNDVNQTEAMKIATFYYYKKPNEIFHLNYALNFLPYWKKTIDSLGTPQYQYEEIFFGDEFINKNGIIPNTTRSKIFYVYATNTPFSMIENSINGRDDLVTLGQTDVHVVSWVVNYTDNVGSKIAGYIECRLPGSANTYDVSQYKSWCIADQYGNIYIAINRRKENALQNASVRFFTSRYRKI